MANHKRRTIHEEKPLIYFRSLVPVFRVQLTSLFSEVHHDGATLKNGEVLIIMINCKQEHRASDMRVWM